MATSSGVTIYAQAADGTQTEITEGVQALYDLVIGSMNWGSGFWTVEDAAPVAQIAQLCGFAGVEETDRYLRERQRDNQRAKLRAELQGQGVVFYEAATAAMHEFPDP